MKRKEAESEQLRKALREMERRTDELLTLRVDSEGQAMEARQRLQVSEAESAALRRTVETEVKWQLLHPVLGAAHLPT